MKLSFSHEFWDEFHQLPPHVQKQAKRAFERFADDPRYPSLHYKCVNKQRARYSIRIGYRFRALGRVQEDKITWYWIGPHSEYDHLI